MSKQVIWAIVGVIVIVLAGWYVMSNPQLGGNLNGETATSTATTTPSASGNAYSFKDLMGFSGSQKCVINSPVGSTVGSGTVYVSSGKVRGDFVVDASGQSVTAHMISDGTNTYTWMDGFTTGYKMPMMTGSTNSAAPTQGVDVNQKLNYNCGSWTVNNTVFTPPTSVTFMSPEAMMAPVKAGY